MSHGFRFGIMHFERKSRCNACFEFISPLFFKNFSAGIDIFDTGGYNKCDINMR